MTPLRENAPHDPDTLEAACATLNTEDTVALEMDYTLSRYEIPVALLAQSRAGSLYLPIAHQELLLFDPR